MQIPDYGNFQGYANRDSLKYIKTYKLNGVRTMLRGTLRNDGFCAAWNIFVQLGCTDDTYFMENVESMTHRDFINSFLPYDDEKSVEEKLTSRFNLEPKGAEMEKLSWLDLFEKKPVGLKEGTPAQILECILNKKWKLQPDDKDMVVMWHRFIYEQNGKQKEIQASLVTKGDDAVNTAMAKGVGLPLGIAAKLFVEGKVKQRGVCLPVSPELYNPILDELAAFGITVVETESEKS